MSANEKTPRKLDRTTAWLCFIANLIVVPGLGNAIAGKRVGYVQAGLALTGFALTFLWFVLFLARWTETKKIPIELNWQLGVGVLGVLLFGAAWLWAFVSGAKVVKDAKPNKSDPP